MVVLILTATPVGLRGEVSRWLEEVAPGVFVGNLGKRVREELWEKVVARLGGGRALMVYRAAGPQRLAYVSHGHDWVPTDFDGLTLMLRPNPTSAPRREGDGPEHLHWSAAARLRRFGRAPEQLRRSRLSREFDETD